MFDVKKKYYVIEIIGKITITRVRNDSAGAGESLKIEMAIFCHFLAKVNWRKYFRQVMSQRSGEFAGEFGGESASRKSAMRRKRTMEKKIDVSRFCFLTILSQPACHDNLMTPSLKKS